MKAAVLILCLVTFALALLPRQDQDLQELEEEFRQWMKTHNKEYASKSEYSLRFSRYMDSAKRIVQLNKNSPSARFGHNKFSDLSPEEFRFIYLKARPSDHKNVTVLTPPEGFEAVSSFDWRSKNVVTAVKDQGQCGSCWAFSVVENVESVWMLSKGITAPSMSALSPQQIVDCDNNDDGCNGGDTVTAYQYVQSAGGLETNSAYPYTAEDGNCNFQSSKVYASINGFKYATDPNNPNEATMMNNLAAWAPLSICVDASSWQNYVGGILKATQCGNQLDHCVQAVGFNTANSVPYWSVRNSWGASWGEQGYIRLEYGKNTCGCADEATTATV